MRFLLIAVGSRGDAEPFCALAHRLGVAGHRVDLFLQSDMQHLAPSGEGINAHVLPFTTNDFYRFVGSPSHGADGDPVERFIGVIADVVGELVLPQWQDVRRVLLDGPFDAMVVSSLARSLAFALSSQATTSVPTYLIHLQPLAPNDVFPNYRNADETARVIKKLQESEDVQSNDISYAETYWETERIQFRFLEERVNKLCAELGLPPLSFERMAAMLCGRDPMVIIVNAFDNEIVPKIPTIVPPKDVSLEGGDETCRLHQLAALADDYLPPTFVPPPDLSAFLEACERKKTKPVCIGFGSMPVGVKEQGHAAKMRNDVSWPNQLRKSVTGSRRPLSLILFN